MTKFYEDDLDELLSQDDFAVTVAWGGRTFDGLYISENQAAEVVGVTIETTAPQLTCKSSDVVGVAHGVRVTVGPAPVAPVAQDDAGGMFVSDVGGEFEQSEQLDLYVIGIQESHIGLTTLILSRNP